MRVSSCPHDPGHACPDCESDSAHLLRAALAGAGAAAVALAAVGTAYATGHLGRSAAAPPAAVTVTHTVLPSPTRPSLTPLPNFATITAPPLPAYAAPTTAATMASLPSIVVPPLPPISTGPTPTTQVPTLTSPPAVTPRAPAVPPLTAAPPSHPVLEVNDPTARLATLRTRDQALRPVRGQWVAQLSSTAVGTVDLRRRPSAFTAADILADVLAQRADPRYGSLVRLLVSGDWASSSPTNPPLYVTVADIDARSRAQAARWCQSHFTQRGTDLDAVCLPKRLRTP